MKDDDKKKIIHGALWFLTNTWGQVCAEAMSRLAAAELSEAELRDLFTGWLMENAGLCAATCPVPMSRETFLKMANDGITKAIDSVAADRN